MCKASRHSSIANLLCNLAMDLMDNVAIYKFHESLAGSAHQHQALHTALYEEALLQLLQQVYKPCMHIHYLVKQPVQALKVFRMTLHTEQGALLARFSLSEQAAGLSSPPLHEDMTLPHCAPALSMLCMSRHISGNQVTAMCFTSHIIRLLVFCTSLNSSSRSVSSWLASILRSWASGSLKNRKSYSMGANLPLEACNAAGRELLSCRISASRSWL